LIQLENESKLLSKLEGFAETIAGAYDGLRQYQDGKVPGQEGVVLDHKTLKTYDDQQGPAYLGQKQAPKWISQSSHPHQGIRG
jgi:hypothetical protein